LQVSGTSIQWELDTGSASTPTTVSAALTCPSTITGVSTCDVAGPVSVTGGGTMTLKATWSGSQTVYALAAVQCQ
jgi:hypothetical protein